MCLASLFIFTITAEAQLVDWRQRGNQEILPSTKHVIEEVHSYRLANEDRIMRELREFLSIPNVASDTPNIRKTPSA